MLSRRSVVGSLGAALLTGIAGCSALQSPDPTVVETEIDGGLDALLGETEVYVVVQNDGAAGDVVVTMELLDDEGTILYDDSRTVEFGADERRRVTFSVDVPEDTSDVRARAEAA
jgi:hypothetical protein